MTKEFLEGLLAAQKAINQKTRGARLTPQDGDLGVIDLDRSRIVDFCIINSKVYLSAMCASLAGAFFS